MKFKKKYIWIAIVFLIVGGFYYWYNKSKSTTTVQYKTIKAQKGEIVSSVSVSGNVIIDQVSNIDPTISGTVYNLSVSVGDEVKKGQLLFMIDNNEVGIQAEQAYSSYLQSKASLETAGASKKEAKENYEDASSSQESIMKEKYEAAKISLEVAERNVQTSWKSYQNSLENASETKATSPIDGTVNEINIENGDSLNKASSNSTDETPIIIGDLNTMKAKVQINEVDISNVKIGQNVKLTFDAIDGLEATGKVEKIDALGTLSNNVVTYDVVISFDSLDERIKPQMSVSAEITTNSKQAIITVPNSAIKTQNGKSYVQVMKNGIPENRNIEIGINNDTYTEIISGINVGDEIVTQTINSNVSTSSNSSSKSSSSSSSNGRGIPPGGMMGF